MATESVRWKGHKDHRTLCPWLEMLQFKDHFKDHLDQLYTIYHHFHKFNPRLQPQRRKQPRRLRWMTSHHQRPHNQRCFRDWCLNDRRHRPEHAIARGLRRSIPNTYVVSNIHRHYRLHSQTRHNGLDHHFRVDRSPHRHRHHKVSRYQS